MCGIAGVFGIPESEASIIIRRMTQVLAHRGPDDSGFHVDGEVALGHRRLCIIDLSEAGRQPMWVAGQELAIVYNGEIYNYRELRQELESGNGCGRWNSRSDTEVILRAYERWGVKCLERLRGMFSFAIYDRRQEGGHGGDRTCRLFLARDRLGIKPLYYYAGDKFFLFSSEVRGLLATGLVPRRLDSVSLIHYLSYQSVPSPRTLVEGVRMLPPGHWLMVDSDRTIVERCYWDLLAQSSSEAQEASPAESRRKIGELLRESVAFHLLSDVPVSVFLSGGIDSSAVAALVREAGHTPQTFSVVFLERAYNEAPDSRKVAALFQTNHTEIPLRERDLLWELPSALRAMDHPSGDGINTYVICQAVQKAGFKVALSGLGGDEMFCGYSSFRRLDRSSRPLQMWGRVPYPLRSSVAAAIRWLGGSSVGASKAAGVLKTNGTTATIFPLMRQLFSLSQCRALLKEPWSGLVESLPDPYVEHLEEAFASNPHAGVLTKISYAESRTYMHDVLLRDMDQMSMAHSLEVRVPLLDHKLAEYLMGLPDSHKRPNGTPKRLLVESLAGLLPEEIVHRPKQGFILPFELWMRGALRQFCEERLKPGRVIARGIFRPEQVESLWQAFLNGQRNISWSRLWILVVLEEWLECNGILT